MIKHGKVYPVKGKTHTLEPIKDFITKGIADAREKLILHPQACDVKGAKRFNGQQCVIARTLNRTMKPQAVAVGRSMAVVVFKGLAIRFQLPVASRNLVEEFDQRGRTRNAPVELNPIDPSWRFERTRSARRARRRPRRRSAPVRGSTASGLQAVAWWRRCRSHPKRKAPARAATGMARTRNAPFVKEPDTCRVLNRASQ